MLVLTRKIGETLRIGDAVTVQVLAVRGGQVSLGLVAPADVRIYREEIYHEIHKQNQDAQLEGPARLQEAAQAWEAIGHAKLG